MPILQPEPSLFPSDLLSGIAPPAEGSGRVWWVLHTRPRQEKSLARELFRRELPFYLPLARKRSRLRGRTLTSHLPLFPGYVFLLADPEERLAALDTSRVIHTLRVPDQAGLWRDLRQVERLIKAKLAVALEGSLAPGALVEITSGPLLGLRGKIIQSASGSRFVVEVDFIRQGASVLVDESTLLRVDDPLVAAGAPEADRNPRMAKPARES